MRSITKLFIAALLMLFASVAHAQVSVFPTTAWPGQAGNLVGYAASPGWPGSFTGTACPSSPASGSSWAAPVTISNCTYSSSAVRNITCSFCIFQYVDFINTSVPSLDHTVGVQADHIMFIGDRFQSNATQTGSVASGHNDIWFLYDSFQPLVSLNATPPGYTQWPGASAGANSTTQTSGGNAVPQANAYEFAVEIFTGGAIVIDHCDIWGYGNAIAFQPAFTAAGDKATITSNWIHDTAYPGSGAGQYHNDGVGYLNTTTAPNNVTMVGNATGMLGNTNALALQQATSGYQNIYINDNYFAGDGATISFCQPGSVQCTNSTFYGNVFGTDIAAGGPLYNPGAAVGAGTIWACDYISVLAGTTWVSPPMTTGQFFVNNNTENNNTDQGSNTVCAVPSPSAYDFGFQASGTSSSAQTVKLYNTNSGTLTGITPTMATGTNFSIVSNGCGSTLASGANCPITVKFAPTALGPFADTLQIADNSTGVSSPQLVPLAGVGITGSGITTISPTSNNFGSVAVGNSSSNVTFTLSNGSVSTVTGITITNVGGNTGDFVNAGTGTCSSTLSASASCTIIYHFHPATTGSRSTTLNVADSDSTSPQQATLTGTGTSFPPGSVVVTGIKLASNTAIH